MTITEYQSDGFLGLVHGAGAVITFHNIIISIVLYKARKSYISNINKIILNLSFLIFLLFGFVAQNTPAWVDIYSCRFLFYMQSISSFSYRTALAFFLLWRLRQVGNSQMDKWASIILLSTRSIAHLAEYGFIRISVTRSVLRNICVVDLRKQFVPETISLCIDFLIDIYVTCRLIQVFRNANMNAAGLRESMSRKTKRTLFTAVMYWNFVRLAAAFGQNLMEVVNIATKRVNINVNRDWNATIAFFNVFFVILMSYVVTVDAEIVKVIEGDYQNKEGSSKFTSKFTSEKSSYSSSSTNRTAYKNTGSVSLPKYNAPNTPTSPQSNHDVSMKRLSFFEWTNLVLGFRHEKNHVQEFTQEEFEEIIERPTGRDPEKGEATNDPNRDSNIKNTTDV
ncbi:hypothetical protein Glove_153g55 [Diversispora epigaea]|uniref:G-protein coupled receptors family 1 profile domain-containing protein n=1 Tax=Diversispora epigaea TaxID=1348612 RepID=A0A397IX65_9GLOM|nr:hypothetical protein Glove_153g55 [Diversispora epigaea]